MKMVSELGSTSSSRVSTSTGADAFARMQLGYSYKEPTIPLLKHRAMTSS